MGIRFSSPPSGAVEILKASLQRLSLDGGATARALRNVDVSALMVGLSHPVYTVATDILATNRSIPDNAEFAAWRFLIVHGSQAVAAVELAPDPARGNLRFSNINTGPFVEATRLAFRLAEGLPEVQNGSYELRALRIASLFVMALWLKNEQGGEDLIVPMNPTHRALTAHPAGQARLAAAPAGPPIAPGVFTLGEFSSTLQPASSEKLAFDDSPRP